MLKLIHATSSEVEIIGVARLLSGCAILCLPAGRLEALQKARRKESAIADDQLSTRGSIPLCASTLMFKDWSNHILVYLYWMSARLKEKQLALA